MRRTEMNALRQPIFFIGAPRSGTTILFEALDRHEDVGWLSNYSDRLPEWPILNVIRYLFDNNFFTWRGQKKQYLKVSHINRFLPRSEEAYNFWQHFTSVDFAYDYLLGKEASNATILTLHDIILKILRHQGRDRFATKITGPGRIHFLRSIFPDAIFVHVIRDGRAVVHSLLKVDFWRNNGGLSHPYWKNGFPTEYFGIWEQSGRDPVALASLQWRFIIESIRLEAQELGGKEYKEILYENFVSSPEDTVLDIQKFCGLNPSEKIKRFVNAMSYQPDMNEKYKKEMTPTQIENMARIMQPLMTELGYKVY